jgi:putative ATPase
MSIEDIGLADPRAMEQAVAAYNTVHYLGIPEGDQALAQVAIYLSVAPKSDAAYSALNSALGEVRSRTAEPVPKHLRNAPTRAMKEWGYGKGYEHAHAVDDGITAMECLPPALAGRRFYSPTNRGVEQRIADRLEQIRALKKGRPSKASTPGRGGGE